MPETGAANGKYKAGTNKIFYQHNAAGKKDCSLLRPPIFRCNRQSVLVFFQQAFKLGKRSANIFAFVFGWNNNANFHRHNRKISWQKYRACYCLQIKLSLRYRQENYGTPNCASPKLLFQHRHLYCARLVVFLPEISLNLASGDTLIF